GGDAAARGGGVGVEGGAGLPGGLACRGVLGEREPHAGGGRRPFGGELVADETPVLHPAAGRGRDGDPAAGDVEREGRDAVVPEVPAVAQGRAAAGDRADAQQVERLEHGAGRRAGVSGGVGHGDGRVARGDAPAQRGARGGGGLGAHQVLVPLLGDAQRARPTGVGDDPGGVGVAVVVGELAAGGGGAGDVGGGAVAVRGGPLRRVLAFRCVDRAAAAQLAAGVQDEHGGQGDVVGQPGAAAEGEPGTGDVGGARTGGGRGEGLAVELEDRRDALRAVGGQLHPAPGGVVDLDGEDGVGGHLGGGERDEVERVPELGVARADDVLDDDVVERGAVGRGAAGVQADEDALPGLDRRRGAHLLVEGHPDGGGDHREPVAVGVARGGAVGGGRGRGDGVGDRGLGGLAGGVLGRVDQGEGGGARRLLDGVAVGGEHQLEAGDERVRRRRDLAGREGDRDRRAPVERVVDDGAGRRAGGPGGCLGEAAEGDVGGEEVEVGQAQLGDRGGAVGGGQGARRALPAGEGVRLDVLHRRDGDGRRPDGVVGAGLGARRAVELPGGRRRDDDVVHPGGPGR